MTKVCLLPQNLFRNKIMFAATKCVLRRYQYRLKTLTKLPVARVLRRYQYQLKTLTAAVATTPLTRASGQ